MYPTDNMAAYHAFKDKINKTDIRVIFELGSRDLLDAIQLATDYQSMVYAFECNPDCLRECHKNIASISSDIGHKIHLIDKAVSITNGPVSFFSFDLEKYNNMGASSMLQIDFTKRDVSDPDYGRENPQKEVCVTGTRLDTFIQEEKIPKVDLLCMDLQGYELQALKSLGDDLRNVTYILTECSIQSTYTNGATFGELYAYLSLFGFQYVCSNRFGDQFPDLSMHGFSEFDALFVNSTRA